MKLNSGPSASGEIQESRALINKTPDPTEQRVLIKVDKTKSSVSKFIFSHARETGAKNLPFLFRERRSFYFINGCGGLAEDILVSRLL